jgi:hypothetical protein
VLKDTKTDHRSDEGRQTLALCTRFAGFPTADPGHIHKKEARIKIQAVAKIQYPIKSLNSNAKNGPVAV